MCVHVVLWIYWLVATIRIAKAYDTFRRGAAASEATTVDSLDECFAFEDKAVMARYFALLSAIVLLADLGAVWAGLDALRAGNGEGMGAVLTFASIMIMIIVMIVVSFLIYRWLARHQDQLRAAKDAQRYAKYSRRS